MESSRRLFTHVNNITATPVPVVANSIPLVDVWKEQEADKIFKTCKGVLVLPVSQYYGIENEALDRFILASKRCYNGNKMLGHLPHYMNYFEKYFDTDHELLMNLYRIKYLIDYEEDYTEEMFMRDIRVYFMAPSIIMKAWRMNEYNYMLDLDNKNYHNDKNPSLLYTDKHAKIMMWMSLMINMMIPAITHFIYVKGILDSNEFLLRVYDIILQYININFGVNIYGKLYDTAASNIQRSLKDNPILWEMQFIRGVNTTTHTISSVNNILLNIIPKYRYDANLISLNYSSIRINVSYQIDVGYDYNFIPLSSSKRDIDQNSEWDKFESLQVRANEALHLQNDANAHSTMKRIEYLFGPFDEEEIEFYKERLKNDDGEIVNGFQKNLIFNLFYKMFGVPMSAYSINKDDYVKLLISAKKMLLANNMVILPYVISAKIERLQIKKSINKRELTRIESSPYYKQIQEKYKNPKIEKYILSLIATILTSDFRIIDYDNSEIDGKKIANIPDIISEEIMMYVDMI